MEFNYLQKRLYNHDESDYPIENTGSPAVKYPKKRRRKSDIGSCSDEDSHKKIHDKSGSFEFDDYQEADEDGLPFSQRTVGRFSTFNEEQLQMNQPYPSKTNTGMNMKTGQVC